MRDAGGHLIIVDHLDENAFAALGWKWSDQPNTSAQHKPGYLCEWESASISQAAVEDRFIPLFNGKDLAGWQGRHRMEVRFQEVAIPRP